MIPEGTNPISPCPSLHTPTRSQREAESPTPESTHLGFPALTPFLSCTHMRISSLFYRRKELMGLTPY